MNKKPKSICRFNSKEGCPQAIWKDHIHSWEMPPTDTCIACRLQAIYFGKK